MAAARTRGFLPVGSAQWINDENAQVQKHCEQEAEDFSFSARNEFEWLNEHMNDIFAKSSMSVVEIFKTPGKIRGKTPRTGRKRNPIEAREPLTDVFSNSTPKAHPLFNIQSRSPAIVPSFKVAEDVAESSVAAPQNKANTDSGYHGSEDEMDIDEAKPTDLSQAQQGPLYLAPTTFHANELDEPDQGGDSSDRHQPESTTNAVGNAEGGDSGSVNTGTPAEDGTKDLGRAVSSVDTVPKQLGIEEDDDLAIDDSHTSSRGSSPAKHLIRKSSLTFAALPAREPLTTKKSIGARTSRTSHLEHKRTSMQHGASSGRFTGGKSLGTVHHVSDELDDKLVSGTDCEDGIESTNEEIHVSSNPDVSLNKSSTQRLHERINLLGKSQVNRPTKSIPAAVAAPPQEATEAPALDTQAPNLQPHAEQVFNNTNRTVVAEDDDEWIQPPSPAHDKPRRPSLPIKKPCEGIQVIGDNETTNDNADGGRPLVERLLPLPDPASGKKRSAQPVAVPHLPLSTSISRPSHADARSLQDEAIADGENWEVLRSCQTSPTSPKPMTTIDGPLSASKSKLQSIMQTARGLFTSSAGASAQAKVEALALDVAVQQKTHTRSADEASALDQVPANKQQAIGESANTCAMSTNEESEMRRINRPREKDEAKRTQCSSVAPSQLQVQQASTQSSKPREVRRPTKPAKEALPKPKPQPVAIRVGTLSTQRIPLTNTNLSASLQESLPPSQPKETSTTGPKKPSLASAASTTGLRTQVGFAKPKALIAAEKKKEQDEKEAQRKLEQKREIERRKAAIQEETRAQEQLQRQETEKQRQREKAATAEDPKRIAQREAIEKRRLELKQKDQPRVLAGSIARSELGGGRPPSRQHDGSSYIQAVATHHTTTHPKAPIKRVFDPETDDAPLRMRPPQSSHPHPQHDSKRRKTEDIEPEDFPMRPTHAPPVRQSNIRKESQKPSIFAGSHALGTVQNAHHQHASSLLKSTTQSQAFQHHIAQQSQISRPGNHPDIKQYGQNGAKIPFGEHPNPSSIAMQSQQTGNAHKTPFQSKMVAPKTASPQYQNGENIHLDDIPTDSDDGSDSDEEASKPKATNLPDWAQSPNLRNLLETQEERMDADTVFGPVASPRMEEMFKERHHRFRSRTSSANWAGADRLTEEEIRRDVEARQRLRRDGGWTFGL